MRVTTDDLDDVVSSMTGIRDDYGAAAVWYDWDKKDEDK